jgi:signal transduction histidine kinase/ActR/RegA family two-component response regulator
MPIAGRETFLATGADAVTKTARGPLRLLSVVVLIATAGMSVALALVVRSVVHDQQRRLLHERTAEAGLLVGSLFNSMSTTLPVLGATTHPRVGSTQQFTAAAKQLTGGVGTIGALQVAGEKVSALASTSTAPAAGTTLTGARAALATRALATKGMISAVLNEPSGRLLSFEVAAGNGLVLYQDIPLQLFQLTQTNASGPFSELDGALYASDHIDPATLVLSTTPHLPLSGTVDRQTVTVGADKWLIAARSNTPLVGSLTEKAPWAVLAAGLLAAILLMLLVETLSRRRAYALALVERQTVELRDALDQQARLEQGQRQARESAEAANRSKSEFLSRMSHELRTPLNAVLGFGQLLELDELNPSQQESVEQIIKGGRHLLELINEVLDISRIETGTLPLSPEPVLVSDLMHDTLTLMRPLADHRNIQLVSGDTATANIHVLADRQRLKQVMLNLIANAIKYNHEGGTVAVSCGTVDPDQLRIHVSDTGPGIRPEDLEQLFVPFERLGAERSDIEGAGVGLALSRRLTEAMGGTLTVASTYGEGSRFTVQLTVVEGPLEQFERVTGTAAESLGGVAADSDLRHKILYIEDNMANVRLVERVFQRRDDVDVIAAMQGRLGVALAREHRPVLILLDLHMPDINGDEVLRQLREDPATATTPVVIVSADATAGQIERLLAEGATGYLTKPLDLQELLAVFSSAVNSTQAAPA